MTTDLLMRNLQDFSKFAPPFDHPITLMPRELNQQQYVASTKSFPIQREMITVYLRPILGCISHSIVRIKENNVPPVWGTVI
jgi:hypothetical protein